MSIGNSSAAFRLPRGIGPRLGLLHWAKDNRLILLTAAARRDERLAAILGHGAPPVFVAAAQ